MLDTPVLFLVFNRPDTTSRVFAQIRAAAPRQLFIAADGPRSGRPGDAAKCREVRDIVDKVDWDCEVKTLFRKENLGCALAVSGAITWFFSQVERGIILEDDTLPEPSFFRFCQTLLEHYADNERVMHIAGSSFVRKSRLPADAYYGSRYPNIWGWATWARAWRNYHFDPNDLPSFEEVLAHGNVALTPGEVRQWKRCFENMQRNPKFTWDYQWFFSLWYNGGVCLTPSSNLITNIGFGAEGTHTFDPSWNIANVSATAVSFPLRHPSALEIDKRKDYHTFKTAHCTPVTFSNKLRNLSYKIMPYEKRKRIFGF
jgi:hypothetical protein